VDIRKIKKLIEMLEESNLTEMEIREGEETIRLSRSAGVHAHFANQPAVASFAPPPPQPAAPIVAAPAPVVSAPASSGLPDGNVQRSPMVGSFYTSAQPGQPVFVKVGQDVKVGDTLAIIEAMKMFNQIESEFAGKIVKILVENGAPVEFDQPLFVIA
jgi:acetyl-CoA carboxylase biotin carboxyl carrier protein